MVILTVARACFYCTGNTDIAHRCLLSSRLDSTMSCRSVDWRPLPSLDWRPLPSLDWRPLATLDWRPLAIYNLDWRPLAIHSLDWRPLAIYSLDWRPLAIHSLDWRPLAIYSLDWRPLASLVCSETKNSIGALFDKQVRATVLCAQFVTKTLDLTFKN